MSVSETLYVVFGIKTTYNKEFSNEYEGNYEEDGIIFDGMGGEYIVFGKTLSCHNGDRCFSNFVELSPNDPLLPEYEKVYKEEFIKKFPKYAYYMNEPFKFLSFVHYS